MPAEPLTEEEIAQGVCAKGHPLTWNPHPDAGAPSALPTVGALRECIPCLVRTRHEWAQRAQAAEARAGLLEAALREARADILAIDGETEHHRFGQPAYDVTLDHLHELATVAAQRTDRALGLDDKGEPGAG